MKNTLKTVAGFLLAVLLLFGLLWLIFPQAGNRFDGKKSTASALTEKHLNYAALGDSLTEGVGDATGQGGFVPLFAKELENGYNLTVSSQNFGKSGDTSEQIYARMTTQDKIKQGLKNANVITITVGGNDVMHVLMNNVDKLSTMTAADFKQPEATYQAELRKIFSTIRQENPDAQIYVLGIYNPFYLNFPNITVMQDIINNWNDATQAVVNSEDKAYFVPINDLLYKGTNGEKGITEDSSSAVSTDSSSSAPASVENNLLYTGDHFHPNNTGYQIMADAVYKAYQAVNK